MSPELIAVSIINDLLLWQHTKGPSASVCCDDVEINFLLSIEGPPNTDLIDRIS